MINPANACLQIVARVLFFDLIWDISSPKKVILVNSTFLTTTNYGYGAYEQYPADQFSTWINKKMNVSLELLLDVCTFTRLFAEMFNTIARCLKITDKAIQIIFTSSLHTNT